jgi:hypothetical protein
MSVTLSPFAGAGWQFFDNNGVPLSGGLVYTYSAGTTTPLATYTSSSGSIANSNPIVLDASGRTPNEIWLTAGSVYKFVTQTSSATQIGSYDNISGINDFTSVYSNIYNAFSASSGATLVGYTQGGTNSVSRTVANKLQETISVKDFGATGNGTTDDTQSIQNAINYLATVSNGNSGGIVFFPIGTYLITDAVNTSTGGLLIATDYIQLVGEGMGTEDYNLGPLPASYLKYTGSKNAINVGVNGPWAYSNFLQGFEIHNLGIIGTSSATNGIIFGTTGANQTIYYPGRVSLTNLSITGFTGSNAAGIRINWVVTAYFHRLNLFSNYNGVSIQGGTTIYFNHCLFRLNSNNGVLIGTNITDCLFDGECVVESNSGEGMQISSNSLANGLIAVRNTHFENNCISTGSYQLNVTGGGSGTTNMFIADAVRFGSENQLGCMSINYVNSAQIMNSQFDASSSQSAIYIGTTTTNVKIDTCYGLAPENIDINNRSSLLLNTIVGSTIYAIRSNGISKIQQLVNTINAPTYGTTVAIDSSLANIFPIVVTNTTAFTVSNPINSQAGQIITIQIKNSSGGAMGAITWSSSFRLAGGTFTNPANGYLRSITFALDSTGSLWYEISRTTADVSIA